MPQTTSKNRTNTSNPLLTALLIVTAIVLLVIANSSFWFNSHIFDSKKFTEIATASLTSESSRLALANGITDRMLATKPILKELIDDQAIKLISGFLDSERVEQVLTRVVMRLQVAMTSENPEPIDIDLTTLKNTIAALTALSSRINSGTPNENLVALSDIPDTLVLVDFSRLPNIYQLGSTLAWLGPVALILGILLLIIPLYQSWPDRKSFIKTMSMEGISLLIGGGIALMLGPIFRPAILSKVATVNARILVENLYNAFLETFNQQTNYIFWAGWILLATAAILWLVERNNSLRKREVRS